MKTVELEPATIANGAVELLNEVSTSKITGEEERYSHIDLVDLVANVEGAKAAFQSVETLLPTDSPVTEAEMDERFDAIDEAMEPYKDGDSYVLYSELTAEQTRAIALTIDGAAVPPAWRTVATSVRHCSAHEARRQEGRCARARP